jgi:2-keto-4-pentenoate hydratase/2-oxohepta-3-ene-1,7-dioic acid hydratase in catechol pathway
LIEVASSVSGLVPGDVIATGTYHIGMGPIQDGDHVSMTIQGIGELTVDVVDPSRREWDVSGLRVVTDSAPAGAAQ